MGSRMKGTVIPLSESLSVADAANVAKKVAEAIDVQRQQLLTLETFSNENESLCKLLLEMPDLISYNVMVPLGKAAFMPGRLIHTNEFLVLLGEGYYAERSAKQAAEILMRRSEFLDSKIDSIKGHIEDLKAEASFARDTAAEAAAGVVEIREEYPEPAVRTSLEIIDELHTSDVAPKVEEKAEDDDEDARIMARIAELERAEAAAGDEDDDEEDEDDETDEDGETNLRAAFRRSLLDDSDEESQVDEEDLEEAHIDERTAANTIRNSSAGGWSGIEDVEERTKFQSNFMQRHDDSEVCAREIRGVTFRSSAVSFQEQGPSSTSEKEMSPTMPPQIPLPSQALRPSAAQQQAFTGTVMERNADRLPPAPSVVPAPEDPPSRPVSKFKQRKG